MRVKESTGEIVYKEGEAHPNIYAGTQSIKPWQVQLFGALQVTCGEVTIQRFRTRRAESLFAYLGFYRLCFGADHIPTTKEVVKATVQLADGGIE